jgi:hypothetical protein
MYFNTAHIVIWWIWKPQSYRMWQCVILYLNFWAIYWLCPQDRKITGVGRGWCKYREERAWTRTKSSPVRDLRNTLTPFPSFLLGPLIFSHPITHLLPWFYNPFPISDFHSFTWFANLPWRWRQQISPKCFYLLVKLQCHILVDYLLWDPWI